jgi:AAHS family 4-hydroxybenzoate transporter-like MFS transporter
MDHVLTTPAGFAAGGAPQESFMADQATIDIPELIDGGRIGAGQWLLTGLCLAVVTLDGFNAQVMGYVAPSLIKGWHIQRAAMGPVASSGLAGLMLGALLLGTVSDRVGRRAVLTLCTVMFGIFSLATALATSPQQMLWLRFLTGLGLGGAVPAAIALVSEFSPKQRRAALATFVVGGFAIGPAIGGFAAAGLIHSFTWRSMFVLGGLIPLMIAPALWFLLPESLRFAASRPDASARTAAALRKVFPGRSFSADSRFVYAESTIRKASVSAIFTEGRGLGTLMLWTAVFMNLIGLNLQTNWLPVVITGLGFPVGQAVTATAMFHLGGVIGGLVLARFAHRFDFILVVAGMFALAGLMTVLIGGAGGSILHLRLAIFGAGLFVVGGQTAIGALSGILYPDYARSTGSGWALGIGRLGAAAGPLIGGNLLSMHLSLSTLFWLESAPFLVAAVAIAVIRLTRSSAL